MTLEQARQLRKAARAVVSADALLRAATDATVVQAAGEYLNARRAHDQAVIACGGSTPVGGEAAK